MGGKKGKERKRDIKGKEVHIHLGYILYTFTVIFTILCQPSGNHLATKRQPITLGLISRDRIGPLATVAKFPWKWYDFLPIPGPTKLQKESPGVTTGYILLFTFSKIHVKIYMSYIKDGCCNGSDPPIRIGAG